VHQNLVLEDPLVPDVDTGIAVRRAGQVSTEMERERPGKNERGRDVAGKNGEV
jgi:hypothetical protein